MPDIFFRFTCDSCRRTWSVKSTSPPAPQPCAVCNGTTRVRKLHSLKEPKDINQQDSIAARLAAGRRAAASAGIDQRASARRSAEAMRRRPSLLDIVDDKDDDLFAPAPAFTPSMRLTPGGASLRASPPYIRVFSIPWTRVREPRSVTHPTVQRAPQQVMALNKGTGGVLSASTWAAEQKLHGPTDPEFEWCHLVADCLGGPTTPDNLVAAGKHANTYMMYIEMACKGRTALEVQVEVLLSADHVAEQIKYRIRKASRAVAAASAAAAAAPAAASSAAAAATTGAASMIEEVIDSRSAGFSQTDRDGLTARLKNKLEAWSPRGHGA